MCTTPLGTLRLDFFEPVFFAGVAIRLGLFGSKWIKALKKAEMIKSYFFLPATVLREPLLVRAFVLVR